MAREVVTRAVETEAETTASVRIRGLHVRRGRTLVLPGLSADIAPGRITGLLGPSGSGKSTLIRSIAGVQRIESGEVTVYGVPAGSRDASRQIGYMTQASSIYADLTVRENLAYWSQIAGADRHAIDRLIETLDLAGVAGQLGGDLSGGQASRVSLACALIGDPPVLLLDEPTVGLDPVLREGIWDILRGRAATGVTILVSSHVMDEADRCDDLILIRQGHILASGTPDEIRSRTGTSTLDAAFLALIKGEAA
ncbi:ABC transporter ATP-binding protein [Actinobaculum sp. 352]|uniref:ABC transporter ATP-binding protein n=1 Tax=Actinobaculum sp. 352 TaxID=2490946 RepID=UPI000F7E4012|nr:ABC transporter ATP-binding protein [Actinobaculum sp. 352]RTE48299.1 ABC transporter ATP-binding protein [Actinobaculum sp. 352]